MELVVVFVDNSKVGATQMQNPEKVDQEFQTISNVTETIADKCGICGDPHFYQDCDYVVINSKVFNKEVPSRAKLSLPDILKIKKLADETYSIFAENAIPAGTEFGPFIAKKNLTLHPSVTFPIKVFINNESDLSEYYLDSTDENDCCWMMFVKPANNVEEQNLICYQEKEDIYFGAIRDIQKGEELKVWYSPYFAYKMQKNTLTFKDSDKLHDRLDDREIGEDVLNDLIKDQQRIIPRAIWNCKFCYKLEKNVTDFAKHLLTHYGLRKRISCQKCQIGFRYNADYHRHMKFFHSDRVADNSDIAFINHRNDKEEITRKFSNCSKQKNNVGGPLLTQYVSESLDNSISYLSQPELNENLFGIDSYDNQNVLFENENLRINLDVIGSGTMRDLDHLDAEIKHSKADFKDFVCDICLKRFSRIKSISTHLKFHIGQYFCSNCKKVFGRLENLKQHKCNSVYSHKCPQCHKLFYQKKYLTQHVSIFHDKKFSCHLCGEKYYSSTDLKMHCCNKVQIANKKVFKCTTCEKICNSNRSLRNHMKIHSLKSTNRDSTKLICSECSETFSSKDAYRRHVTVIHEKRQSYDCKICDRKFNRKDILKKHVLNIHTVDQTKVFPCATCKKEFKSKDYLNVHIKLSHEYQKYNCKLCDTEFKFSRNLQRHIKMVHNRPDFDMRIGYECPVCNIKVKLKGSLGRHIKKRHPEAYKKQCADLRAKREESRHVRYKCPICHKELKWEATLRRHMSTKHPDEENTSNRGIESSAEKDKKPVREFDEEFDNYMDLQKTIENMDFTIDTCNGNLFSGSETIDRFLEERSDQISIFCADSPRTTIPVNEIVSTVTTEKSTNREVGLSMPDLSYLDQDIKLVRNPQTVGNNFESPLTINALDDVVLYVLNEKGN